MRLARVINIPKSSSRGGKRTMIQKSKKPARAVGAAVRLDSWESRLRGHLERSFETEGETGPGALDANLFALHRNKFDKRLDRVRLNKGVSRYSEAKYFPQTGWTFSQITLCPEQITRVPDAARHVMTRRRSGTHDEWFWTNGPRISSAPLTRCTASGERRSIVRHPGAPR